MSILHHTLWSEFHTEVFQAAKEVDASQEALVDLFESIENFFKRLESYTVVPPTDAMTEIIVKIMVEVINVFAIATKEIKQSRTSVFSLRLDMRGCKLIYVQKNL